MTETPAKNFSIGRPDFPAGCMMIFGGSGGLGRHIAGLLAERSANVVIAAQGSKFATGPSADASQNGLRPKLDMDVFGFSKHRTSLHAGPKAGRCSITAIISPAVLRTLQGYGLCVTPKAAVASMVKYLAADEGPNAVRVNAVAPGVINAGLATKITDGSGKAMLDSAVQATPLRRMSEAAEVAEFIVFLASAKAGYVTGQVIMVDGGFSL